MSARVLRWLAASLLCAAVARAESVPIGRYTELRAGAAAGHPWATSGGDDGRTGRSRARVPRNAPGLVWRLQLSATHVVPPAVRADGMLLVGASDGVHAIDPRGEQRWFSAIGPVRFTPALGPDGESVAIAQGRLYLISPGGRARELEIAAPAMGAPLLLDSGALVVLGLDERAHVLGLDGGYLAGAPSGSGPSRWTLASGDGWVVVAGFGRELTLVSPYGDASRSVRLPGGLAVSPVASGGVIWAIGQSGSVWLIGASDHVRTLAELGVHGVGVAPALGHDGALRVALRHGEIACHDTSGKERWRRGIDGAPSALLVDADDSTLLISSRGTLYAIARDGSLLWRQRTDLSGPGRPVLGADGTVYLIGRGGRIEAWR